MLVRKTLVEFLGAVLLSFVVFYTGHYLAIGLALAAAVFLGGAISGGAFNPAIAIGLWFSRKINQNELLFFILAEILGAVVGYYISKQVKRMN
jgi:glycerol uptake facilitator-like aquaporin